MANEIAFELTNQESENLWAFLSGAPVDQLGKNSSIPYALYELRKTLDQLRQPPEDEDSIKPQAQVNHCLENNLSKAYFPKAGSIHWKFDKYLLPILKLVLKYYVSITNGTGVETILKLCTTLRLKGWFLKNFKKPVSIDLGEDDCDLDDEVEEATDEPVTEETSDESGTGESDTEAAAADD